MKYDILKIAEEIRLTALGEKYYGNSLRVAKEIGGLDINEIAILEIWLDESARFIRTIKWYRDRLMEIHDKLIGISNEKCPPNNSISEEEPSIGITITPPCIEENNECFTYTSSDTNKENGFWETIFIQYVEFKANTANFNVVIRKVIDENGTKFIGKVTNLDGKEVFRSESCVCDDVKRICKCFVDELESISWLLSDDNLSVIAEKRYAGKCAIRKSVVVVGPEKNKTEIDFYTVNFKGVRPHKHTECGLFRTLKEAMHYGECLLRGYVPVVEEFKSMVTVYSPDGVNNGGN